MNFKLIPSNVTWRRPPSPVFISCTGNSPPSSGPITQTENKRKIKFKNTHKHQIINTKRTNFLAYNPPSQTEPQDNVSFYCKDAEDLSRQSHNVIGLFFGTSECISSALEMERREICQHSLPCLIAEQHFASINTVKEEHLTVLVQEITRGFPWLSLPFALYHVI